MSFKTFDQSQDVAEIVSSINEVVNISSSIFNNDLNVKFYNNIASSSAAPLGGYWESVYDSSPTSSLSTGLIDITYGYSTGSIYNVSVTTTSSQTEKIKIYRQFAASLLGDSNSIFTLNGTNTNEFFFLLIKRNIAKDEIKKGSVYIEIKSGSTSYPITDVGAASNFKQGVGGDYAPLLYNGTGSEMGQVWYQAGVVLINDLAWGALPIQTWTGSVVLNNCEASGTISQLADGFRKNVHQINIHNQTNLYSTIYFCRARNTEFNYSSNPTYIDDDMRIRVTSGSNSLKSRSYITTIGLYDANDNLLGVGKVNKPIMKSGDNEQIFRLRLDF